MRLYPRKEIQKIKQTREAPYYYDVVVIVGGPYAGRLGYYDDDEGAKAIVYLQGEDSYIYTKLSSLRIANAGEKRMFLKSVAPVTGVLMTMGGPGLEMPRPELVEEDT